MRLPLRYEEAQENALLAITSNSALVAIARGKERTEEDLSTASQNGWLSIKSVTFERVLTIAVVPPLRFSSAVEMVPLRISLF